MSTGPWSVPSGAELLSSFERPARAHSSASAPARVRLSADLENRTAIAKESNITVPAGGGRSRARRSRCDHRQDIKGRWWMPWHQEPKKGVDGCDKPRVGAE